MKTFKGFDKDLRCRGFQYEVGKTYECNGKIELCSNGFHAIVDDVAPLTVFDYYPPADENGNVQRYCEVEAEGTIKDDGQKMACFKLTVGAEIGIPGIIKAHIEWVKENLRKDKTEEGDGDSSAATVTGKDSVAIVTGCKSKARASIGSAIVICERGEWNGETYPLLSIKAAIVDGKNLKADTWYTLKDGEFVEVKE